MKFINNLFFASLVLLVSITGCKDDEAAPVKESKATYDGSEYSLTSGLIENYGEDSSPNSGWDYSGYNLDLVLLSDGITLTNNNGEPSVEGEGFAIYFEMFSSTADALADGTYTLDVSNNIPTGTYDYGDVNFVSNGTVTDNIEIASGTIIVAKSGNEYEITVDCYDVNQNQLSAYYKGELMYFDYTSSTNGRVLTKSKNK